MIEPDTRCGVVITFGASLEKRSDDLFVFAERRCRSLWRWGMSYKVSEVSGESGLAKVDWQMKVLTRMERTPEVRPGSASLAIWLSLWFVVAFAIMVNPVVARDPELRIERNLVFHEVQNEQIKADLYRPADDQRRPAVILIHGGGWATGDKWNMAEHARELAREGFVAIAVNYRLAPKWKFPAQVDDCREALKWTVAVADQYQIDSEKLAVYGYSAGAHLAALMACNPSQGQPAVRAVVAGGAPCDFCDLEPDNATLAYFLGGSRSEVPEVYREASPKEFASADDPPFFFFHGQVDRMVPLDNSRCLHDALQKHGVDSQFHEVLGQGHLLTFIDADARNKAITFLKKYLQSDNAAQVKTPSVGQ